MQPLYSPTVHCPSLVRRTVTCWHLSDSRVNQCLRFWVIDDAALLPQRKLHLTDVVDCHKETVSTIWFPPYSTAEYTSIAWEDTNRKCWMIAFGSGGILDMVWFWSILPKQLHKIAAIDRFIWHILLTLLFANPRFLNTVRERQNRKSPNIKYYWALQCNLKTWSELTFVLNWLILSNVQLLVKTLLGHIPK